MRNSYTGYRLPFFDLKRHIKSLTFSLPLMMSPLVLASVGSATEADGGPLLVVAVIVLFSGSLMMVRWSD